MVTVLLSGEDYLRTNEPSRFSREFKLEALRRMEAGENVSVLARELRVSRKSIYQWRNRYRVGRQHGLARSWSKNQSRDLGSRGRASSRETARQGGSTNVTGGAGAGATPNCRA